MPILYLHGANMTERSFILFRKSMKQNSFCPEYHIDDGLKENIKYIEKEATKHFQGKPVDIIAHSMGGIIALALLKDNFPIRRIVTMSAPFGGSIVAGQLKYMFPAHQLFADIDHGSSLIKELKSQKITVPMKSFVTVSGGSPLKLSQNDGVVSVESQLDLKGPKYKKVKLNHFEILLCEDIVQETKEFLK